MNEQIDKVLTSTGSSSQTGHRPYVAVFTGPSCGTRTLVHIGMLGASAEIHAGVVRTPVHKRL